MAVKEAVLPQLEIEFTTYFSAQNSIVEAYKETHNDDILIMSRHILTEEGIQDITDADIKSLHPTINIGSLVSALDWAEQFYTTYEQQIENELDAKELNKKSEIESYGTLDIMEQEVLNFIMNNEMFLSIKIEFEPADIQALRQTNLSADFICDAMHRHYDENDFIEYIEQNQIDDIIAEVYEILAEENVDNDITFEDAEYEIDEILLPINFYNFAEQEQALINSTSLRHYLQSDFYHRLYTSGDVKMSIDVINIEDLLEGEY